MKVKEKEFMCKIHGVQKIPYNQYQKGYRCRLCAKEEKLENYKQEASLIHENRYSYEYITIDNFKKKKQKVILKCNQCEEVFSTWFSAHLSSNNRGICPNCNPKNIPLENQIAKAKLVHNRYDYSLIKEQDYSALKNKVPIICPDHGIFYQNLNNHISGQGCPACSLPKGEIMIKNKLDELGIEYIQQKTFKGCKYKQSLHFDFYIPELNLCIEFDGVQHFEAIEFFGGEEGLVKIQHNDKIKNDYCLNNSILLIRIDNNWSKEYLEEFFESLNTEYITNKK